MKKDAAREKKKKQKAHKAVNWLDEEEWFFPAISPASARKYYYTGVSEKILEQVKEYHETIPEKWADDPDVMGVEDIAPYRLRWDKDGICKGGVVPTTLSSFDHPAKMLPPLAARIILTYSKEGDWILDPMCGIGTSIVEGLLRKRNVIGIELEHRWSKVAWQNIHQTRKSSLFFKLGRAMVIQGDARSIPYLISEYNSLRALFGEEPFYGDLIITSPPYGNVFSKTEDDWEARQKRIKEAAGNDADITDKRWFSKDSRRAKSKEAFYQDDYGDENSQIANKPMAKVDTVIFSPPYGDLIGRDRLAEPSASIMDDMMIQKVTDHLKYGDGGENIGQKGSHLIGSVKDTLSRSIPGRIVTQLEQVRKELDTLRSLTEAQDPKNKGYIDLVAFSPPYADVVATGKGEGPHTHVFTKWLKNKYGIEDKVEYSKVERYFKEFSQEFSGYSTNENNIGNEKVETYWDSMRTVYEGCLSVLKPGGYCILVTGDYYREKKRVPIGDDTIRLMENIGFEFMRRHKRIYNNRSFFIMNLWLRCDYLKIGRKKEGQHNRKCVYSNMMKFRQEWMLKHIDEAKKWPTREWCREGNCPGWINTLEKIDWEDVLVFRKQR